VVEWLYHARRVVADVWLGLSGQYAYEQYVEHRRRHHPEQPIATREEFFRRELTEGWEGIRRCC
jgi:uncharacterized short protein YbdD (DUF466 family)